MNKLILNFINNIGKTNFNITIPYLNILFKLIYFILIIFILIYDNKRVLLLIKLLILLFIPTLKKYTYSYKLYFLDVGQGDSSVYISKNTSLVVDAFNNVYNLLIYEGILTIDFLILTHNHLDHVKEANYLIDSFKVKNVILNNFDEFNIKHHNITYINSYQTIYYNEIKLEFFYLNFNFSNINNNSLVFKLHTKDNNILYTGDIEKEAELMLLSVYKEKLKSDILKVAHHGSITSSNLSLLKEINPTYAIISVGKDNYYNLPDNEVLERLNKLGVNTFRTDKTGTVLFFNNKIHFK